MSPAKQKSNERQAARDRKGLSRQAPATGGLGANAYNPSSGTFHTLESVSSEVGTGYLNGRFRTIDDTDDPNGGGTEFECMSNNDSCSGESEDQVHPNGKDKHGAGKLGNSSGVGGGADKRDKMRGKNERKHQRQKERRAQELRDKCTGYLMSRKLEALSQQLVAMGFSQERATMALIFNDGHVEQSVAWLLEGGEGQVTEDWNTGGNPKIDISEELGHIVEIEKKYRYSRPDIERAIVSFEGDLNKALDFLRAKGQNTSPLRDSGGQIQGCLKDGPAIVKDSSSLAPTVAQNSSGGLAQQRVNSGVQPAYQVRKEDKGLMYLKGRQQSTMVNSHASSDVPTSKGPVLAKKLSSTLADMQRALPSADNSKAFTQGTRPTLGAQKTSFSYMPPSYPNNPRSDATGLLNINGPDSKVANVPGKESFVNSSAKLLTGTGQLPPGLCAAPQVTAAVGTCPVSSSPMLSSSSWSRGFMDVVSPSSVLFINSTLGDIGLTPPNVGKKAVDAPSAGVISAGAYFNTLAPAQSDSQWTWADNALPNQNTLGSSSSPVHSASHSRSSSLTSYGLYTGWGNGFANSSVDWSTGPMVNCDYRNIDWSMSVSPSATTEGGGGGLRGLSNSLSSLKLQEKSNYSGWSSEEELLGTVHYVTESTAAANGMGIWKVGSSSSGAAGVQENSRGEPANSSAFGVHEWTSPFAGKDLFKLPQAVPSPSL